MSKCLQETLDQFRATRENDTWAKFNRLSAQCDEDASQRIRACLSRGDIMTAHEMMSRIENGQPLVFPKLSGKEPYFRTFMSVLPRIDHTLSTNRSPEQIRILFESRKIYAELQIQHERKRKSTSDATLRLIDSWYDLKVQGKLDHAVFKTLVELLGLRINKIDVTKTGPRYSVLMLECDSIEDRDQCPVPMYGSDTRGRYQLILNWSVPARESISSLISGGSSCATIMLYFGRLGDKNRQWLRNWSMKQHRQFLTIDESLVIYLATLSSGRLTALFSCTLPFSDVEPYVTTSSLVPPELFFGRERERRQLKETHGPCFIYGGRQLGKTALLRAVERDFHQPELNQFAKWIDLRVREIGQPRQPAEIWPLLWDELRAPDFRVVQGSVAKKRPNPYNQDHIDNLILEIQRWVKRNEHRRLLLLLDEADEFLRKDAQEFYRVSTRLKGLMESTKRRVKVVFAGLHNVVRVAEQANHPFLGDPINVGPLLVNGEWYEAHNLILHPLRAMGFEFEPRELSTLILAQTNYFPSLIQLYCAELVKHLRDQSASVPRMITDEDLAAVYKSGALRDAIRQRFRLTLQLDRRYEVIAYVLAFEFLSTESLEDGIHRRDIAEHCRQWWNEGFEQDSEREFYVLLQEMEGLGVLRSRNNGKYYTFRNPNVLVLLGSQKDIEEELCKTRQAPNRFSEKSSHGTFAHDDSRLCPLTYSQESRLRKKGGGVMVVAGCEASGIDQLCIALKNRIEAPSFRDWSDVLSVRDFENRLKRLRPKPTGPSIVVVVSHPCPWNWDWIVAARERLNARKWTREWIKVAFLADPTVLDGLIVETGGRSVASEVEWMTIRPWDLDCVRYWLNDKGISFQGVEQVKALLHLTGGWSEMLSWFLEPSKIHREPAWGKRIERLERRLLSDGAQCLQMLGIVDQAKHEMKILIDSLAGIRTDGGLEEDLKSVAKDSGCKLQTLRRRLLWSERLAFIDRSSGEWLSNPLVERIVARK